MEPIRLIGELILFAAIGIGSTLSLLHSIRKMKSRDWQTDEWENEKELKKIDIDDKFEKSYYGRDIIVSSIFILLAIVLSVIRIVQFVSQ